MTENRNEYGHFAVANKYGEPLSKRVLGLRLPESVLKKLMELHPEDSGEWVRDVIIEAVRREVK